MITFDSVPPEEMEAMCTPMHLAHDPSSTGALYLGSMAALHEPELLRAHGITHLVQAVEVPWLPQDDATAGFASHRIDIEDRSSAALRPHLAAACDYIHAALLRGDNVLVHCQQGVSRSASIVIAYFIREYEMAYDDAFALVRKRRPCIRPNSGFVTALREWDDACASERGIGERKTTGGTSGGKISGGISERKNLGATSESNNPDRTTQTPL
ncbi:protein-tyrosine phosphatase-like protein [Mycena galericulata]|nr:protein-tyrosine phosphatase-like protein [Mycena galericulata]